MPECKVRFGLWASGLVVLSVFSYSFAIQQSLDQVLFEQGKRWRMLKLDRKIHVGMWEAHTNQTTCAGVTKISGEIFAPLTCRSVQHLLLAGWAHAFYVVKN